MNDSQQRLLKTILTGFPGFMVLKNKQLVYEVVNPAFCQFLAKAPDEIVGKKDTDLFPGPESAAAQKEDKAAMDLGMPRKSEQTFTGAKGARWFEVSRCPIFDDDGDPAGILLFANEITAFKEREQAVRAGEAKLDETNRQLAEAAARAQTAEAELQSSLAKAAQQDVLRAQLREKDEILAARQQELAAAQDELQAAQRELIEKARGVAEAQESSQAARGEVARLQQALNQAQEKQQQYEQQMHSALAESARASEQLQAALADSARAGEQLQAAQAQAQAMREQTEALQKQCQAMETAGAARAVQLEQCQRVRQEVEAIAQQLLDKLRTK